MKVTILHPGSMGSTVAMALLANGHEVFWVPDGRSNETRRRAESLGLKSFASVEDATKESDVIISICMGGGVVPNAIDMGRCGFAGIFVDLNYVGRENEINDLRDILGANQVRYVEGAIYGWPYPSGEGQSNERVMYLGGPSSGPDTEVIAELFRGSIFEVQLSPISAKLEKEKRVAQEAQNLLPFKNWGWGIVEFPDVAKEIDDSFVDEWLARRRQTEPSDYTINADGMYVSRGGYLFTKRQIMQAPERYMNLSPSDGPREDVAFHEYLQQVMFWCIHSYTGIYPECKDAVWWGADGHVAVYEEGGQMGVHHDTAVGGATGNENPIFLTVSGSLVISDRCEGGDLYFSHIGKSFAPQKGSAILYPSSYMGAHGVSPVLSGTRIAYLEFYGHGTRSGQTRKI